MRGGGGWCAGGAVFGVDRHGAAYPAWTERLVGLEVHFLGRREHLGNKECGRVVRTDLFWAPNGLRYLRVGGLGFCLGAGKTRSEKNA